MQLKPLNTFTVTLMLFFTFLILFFSGFLEFPSVSSSIQRPFSTSPLTLSSSPHPFTDLLSAFRTWDSQMGCARFKLKHHDLIRLLSNSSGSLQEAGGESSCNQLKMEHVSVLVKGWTWIPDNLDNLYSCRCGMSCLWTKSSVLADKPDALLFETSTPSFQRHRGDPLRVYMDLEAGRKRSGREDIFISYHAKDDVQSTYAGALFHNGRNYHISSDKNNDTLVYWSSSRCLSRRNQLAKSLLKLLPHHSFGKCLNNVGGLDMALSFYPECANDANNPKWWDHLHCAMSHYKFALAIENTVTESYVTEKLFYALDSGAVPIYFGAPNVLDFVPPYSIIDGTKFSSMEELASYVKAIANDPVAYAEYHAWRRCGVLGNYAKARAASLDTLPCRLCEVVSTKGGRNARTE
ncbi:Alpha-(1,4)-fucosyltransferase [Hibiscus syriacus]|uniref:Fucosyltransferase n=1 Tax=Hibiscus syriacus TaxID=106335 RepID=A0A6A2YA17_HIBSY|nr:alpha-(1,4)-fucosyltransferase-like [Hibiscus syriacus]XP_039028164.1 alpha-(1,4)-fucosyltransferase-like [Hibiscus syriacus]KAE8679225.1 Alpha-(1,4)-fucosyltransferase [Hibiscus syriacus]